MTRVPRKRDVAREPLAGASTAALSSRSGGVADPAVIVRYLARSPDFPGIGYATAGKLASAFGQDLARVLGNRDSAALEPVVGGEAASAIAEGWTRTLARGDALVWLAENGFDPKLAGRVVDLWGDRAVEVVRSDPYALVTLVPFRRVDAAALRLGIGRDDPRRAAAAVEAELYNRLDRHHTWTAEERVVHEVMDLLGCNPGEAGKAIDLASGSGAAVRAGDGWQPAGAAMMEGYVADRVRRAALPPEQPDLIAREVTQGEVEGFLDDWSVGSGVNLDPEQRAAVQIAVGSRFGLVLGGAGVGKTTVLRAAADACAAFGRSVHMMALAGRAAVRIREATGRPASTIAAFLKAVDARQIPLGPESLVIVDESSMLDLPTAYRLLRAIPEDARLLLVGDPAQLPPIGFGLTFHVLAESRGVPKAELVRVHRQSGETGIPEVSARIRRGMAVGLRPFRGAQPGVSLVRARPDEMAYAVADLAAELGGIGGDLRILCAVKGGPSGVESLNAMFHRFVAGGRARQPFTPGEPVMYLRNDYRRDLRNGSLGTVTGVLDDAVDADFGGVTQRFTGSDLDNLQLAYAMTVHKSQGSQFDRVIVPLVRSPGLDRSLLYTAVTRAVVQAVLVGNPEAFAMAVARPPAASARNVALELRLAGIA